MLIGVSHDDSALYTEVCTLLWATFLGQAAPECFIKESIRIPDSRTQMFQRMKPLSRIPGSPKTTLTLLLINETFTSLYTALCEMDSRLARETSILTSLAHTLHRSQVEIPRHYFTEPTC